MAKITMENCGKTMQKVCKLWNFLILIETLQDEISKFILKTLMAKSSASIRIPF